MSDISLDATTGDILISGGDFVLNSGADSVRQDMQSRFRTFKGEWFLDQRVGIPYFADIFVKAPNIPLIRTILTRVASETSGVASISDVSIDLDGSARRMTFTVSGVLDEAVGTGEFTFTFDDLVIS